MDLAISLNPKFDKAYYKRGLLLKEKGDFISAFKSFESAIKLNSSYSKAHYSMAVLLMDKEANKVIEKHLKQKKWFVRLLNKVTTKTGSFA